MIPLAVTTSGSVDAALSARARSAALRWGLPFVPRRVKQPLEGLVGTAADALIVIERGRVALWDREGPLRFHLGLAALRLQRIEAGQVDDTFLRISELKPGDAILDCTLGLAQDAMVAARMVGPSGRVVGVEKSLALSLIVSEGLAAMDLGPASARIEVVRSDALEFLRKAAPRSFDVVYFDPMFEKPRKAQPSFEVLRRHADHSPLTVELIAEARRVARRRVVVKGSRYTRELIRLGLEPITLSRFADVAWARIDV